MKPVMPRLAAGIKSGDCRAAFGLRLRDFGDIT